MTNDTQTDIEAVRFQGDPNVWIYIRHHAAEGHPYDPGAEMILTPTAAHQIATTLLDIAQHAQTAQDGAEQ